MVSCVQSRRERRRLVPLAVFVGMPPKRTSSLKSTKKQFRYEIRVNAPPKYLAAKYRSTAPLNYLGQEKRSTAPLIRVDVSGIVGVGREYDDRAGYWYTRSRFADGDPMGAYLGLFIVFAWFLFLSKNA